MNTYFGTAGIRGLYGSEVTEDLAFRVGVAVGLYFGGTCLIARDTRPSGEALLKSIISGLSTTKCKYHDAGILPTPAVSALVNRNNFSCGIMITASHNPVEYNGIKIFREKGLLLDLNTEKDLEQLIKLDIKLSDKPRPLLVDPYSKSYFYYHYLDYLTTHSLIDLSDLHICLDVANGATRHIAIEAFERCGAIVEVVNKNIPSLINHQCGATYPESILGYMKSRDNRSFDLGFAFDGDGDRVVVIYNDEVLDGDSVLYNLSQYKLPEKSTIVGTFVNNSALPDKLASEQSRFIRTQVGGKHILDMLIKNDFSLGGEQCGHYTFYPYNASSDGLYAALILARHYKVRNKKLEKLNLYPQKTLSINFHKDLLDHPDVVKLINSSKKKAKNLLVRMSGTEPKLRVMVEADDEKTVDSIIDKFKKLAEKLWIRD